MHTSTPGDHPRYTIGDLLREEVADALYAAEDAFCQYSDQGLRDVKHTLRSVASELFSAYSLNENPDYKYLALLAEDALSACDEVIRVHKAMRDAVDATEAKFIQAGVPVYDGVA